MDKFNPKVLDKKEPQVHDIVRNKESKEISCVLGINGDYISLSFNDDKIINLARCHFLKNYEILETKEFTESDLKKTGDYVFTLDGCRSGGCDAKKYSIYKTEERGSTLSIKLKYSNFCKIKYLLKIVQKEEIELSPEKLELLDEYLGIKAGDTVIRENSPISGFKIGFKTKVLYIHKYHKKDDIRIAVTDSFGEKRAYCTARVWKKYEESIEFKNGDIVRFKNEYKDVFEAKKFQNDEEIIISQAKTSNENMIWIKNKKCDKVEFVEKEWLEHIPKHIEEEKVKFVYDDTVARKIEPIKEEKINNEREIEVMKNTVEIKVNGEQVDLGTDKVKKEKSDYKKRAKVIAVYFRKDNGSKVKTEEFKSEDAAIATMQEPRNFEYKLVTYTIGKVTEIKVPLASKPAK